MNTNISTQSATTAVQQPMRSPREDDSDLLSFSDRAEAPLDGLPTEPEIEVSMEDIQFEWFADDDEEDEHLYAELGGSD